MMIDLRRTTRLKFYLVAALVVLGWCFTPVTHAATLSVSPGTGVYTSGQTFTTRVVVNTNGAAINASEATITFNPAQLSVVSVTKGSTFSLWAVEPSFSNTAGTITFGGGSPAGYTGSNGTVLNITWRSKGAGTARVNFQNGSVLAADGRGTNVVQSLYGGNYTITAADVAPEPEVIEYIAPANTPGRPEITSTTHQNDGWSALSTATLTWSVPADVTEIRTLLDANSGSIPTRVYETPINTITLDDLAEGVQFFHLQFRNQEGWGRVAHYRLAVDTIAPEEVKVQLVTQNDAANPVQVMAVTTATGSAPITQYSVQLDGGAPVIFEANASGTITLQDLAPGYHTAIVEVRDAAGNTTLATLSFTIESFAAPVFTEVPDRFDAAVIPVFIGMTRADATVRVSIAAVNSAQAPMEYSVTADNGGQFTVIPDGRFTVGVYEMTAVATDVYGAMSAPSDTVRLVVDTPGYIKFGNWLVSILSVFVPLLALLALSGLFILWFVVRARKVRQYVIAETDEALQVLKDQFSRLHSTVEQEAETLAESRKTNKLTKAETDLIATIRAHIASTEETIQKEISDVDDILR